MPVSKNKKSIAISQQEKEMVYPTDKLLKSRYLAGYQQDFARAILTEKEYSLKEAVKMIEERLKGGC